MAPPFDIGTPQRSLVRIPGSGSDKTLKPVCLDVAQISNFSRSLGDIVNFNFNAPPEQIIGGTLNISPSILPTHSSVTGLSGQQVNVTNRKRNSEVEEEHTSKKRTSETNILKNISLTPQERIKKMKLLKEEEKQLLKENEVLVTKVNMFKEILRSRSKLNEFLKALEEITQCANNQIKIPNLQ